MPLLLLLLGLHRRTHTGQQSDGLVNELRHDAGAGGLVGKRLGDETQPVEHVARVRVPQRAVAQHQELDVEEGREEAGAPGEHQDEAERGDADLREGDQPQQVRGLELDHGDGEACWPARVLSKELKGGNGN